MALGVSWKDMTRDSLFHSIMPLTIVSEGDKLAAEAAKDEANRLFKRISLFCI
jgi:hypothetical protein